jgi:hypothetical protein
MVRWRLRLALLSGLLAGCAVSYWYEWPFCCVDGTAKDYWVDRRGGKCIGPIAGYDSTGAETFEDDPEYCRARRFPPVDPPYRVELADSPQKLFLIRARNDTDSLVGWTGTCAGEQDRVSVPWTRVAQISYFPGQNNDVPFGGNARDLVTCVQSDDGPCCDVPEGQEGYRASPVSN